MFDEETLEVINVNGEDMKKKKKIIKILKEMNKELKQFNNIETWEDAKPKINKYMEKRKKEKETL